MKVSLQDVFLKSPIAHRALHDEALGRAENNFAAIEAAIEHGFGIEIDIQQSKDGQAMVFHDYHLDRLTEAKGPFAQLTATELGQVRFRSGEKGVPTLAAILDHVAGRAPLLIEIKDQDGVMGPNVGPLEREVARLLQSYSGAVAVMSFNPHAIAVMADAAPQIPRGLTTCGYLPQDWPLLSEATRADLRKIPDFDRVGASFVSHQWTDLASERIQDLKGAGARILCWTIRSAAEAAEATLYAENITFESYVPA
ncbi:glycerophosphodiester phosphodiesterase family protein [Pacificibacter sp. AS14]|uniref:glycerophosphodiester phosphodiesterase family protein n=1 Tax=Pacificibacter sp. AS14 TaxID=3135785 RepID=UPI00316F9FE4